MYIENRSLFFFFLKRVYIHWNRTRANGIDAHLYRCHLNKQLRDKFLDFSGKVLSL